MNTELLNRTLFFLHKCTDSPDTSIRREANFLYGELAAMVDSYILKTSTQKELVK